MNYSIVRLSEISIWSIIDELFYRKSNKFLKRWYKTRLTLSKRWYKTRWGAQDRLMERTNPRTDFSTYMDLKHKDDI